MKHLKTFEGLLNEGGTTLMASVEGDREAVMKAFKERVESVERPGPYSGDWDQFGGIDFKNSYKKFETKDEAWDWIENNHEKWDDAMAIEYQPGQWAIGGWVSESESLNNVSEAEEKTFFPKTSGWSKYDVAEDMISWITSEDWDAGNNPEDTRIAHEFAANLSDEAAQEYVDQIQELKNDIAAEDNGYDEMSNSLPDIISGMEQKHQFRVPKQDLSGE